MPYHHCNSSDRDRLQLLYSSGKPMKDIAEDLQKHISTLYRELSRNRYEGHYISGRAQTLADERRLLSKPSPVLAAITVAGEVRKRLRKKHSPEQISGRLRREFPTDVSKHASTETIYRYAYRLIQCGETDIATALRHGHKKRHKRPPSKEKRGSIPDRTMIDQRPAEVDSKETCGHWEGDTMEGAKKSGYLATFTERTTKVLLARPISNKTADLLNDAARLVFKAIPAPLRKTLTVDNGKEFARHRDLKRITKVSVYFAHPYHSWERGLNEHTNGLLRQYFPKNTDLKNLNPRKLAKVVDEINNRPRKCLNYRTPLEAFLEAKFALQI